MRGDRVEIVIDAGGTSRTYEVTATRAGRRVEVVTGRGVVEVMEVTRGGAVVRTARFMSSRVLALVEHPAGRGAEPEEARPAGKPRADRATGSGTPPARVPRVRPAGAAEASGAASAEPARAAEASGPGAGARTEPASSPETGPGEPGEPASMVEDAVDRTASQLG
jgi:hypothetical protein